MAAKVTFDTVNKLIICKAGVTELDAKVDIYSDTKEDWQTNSDLTKLRFIFRSIGGDGTSPGETAPLYSFINYGWRIRPDEADHVLNIINGAILVEGDVSADPFVDTVGDFTVRIRMYVPIKATIVSSGSGVTEQDKLDIAGEVWDKDLTTHDTTKTAGALQQCVSYDNTVVIDTVNGVSGTTWNTGTHKNPVDNLTDALIIATARKIDKLVLHSDITIEATHDVSGMSIETMGIMGTTVTFGVGCTADNSVIRYANVEGTVTNGDTLLLESCSIGNLLNFTGIMNIVAFGDGAEISVGYWANIIQASGGGAPSNEPEISIGTGALNLSHYTGNLKLTDKTGTDRSIINCASGNLIIDSTCVAGKIQILGQGQVEADNSGVGCDVDTDGFISISSITTSVWSETLNGLGNAETLIADLVKLTGHKVTKSGDVITIYESDESTPWRQYDLTDGGRVEV